MARVRSAARAAARALAAAAATAALLTGCATGGGAGPDGTPSSRPAEAGGTQDRIGALFVGDVFGPRGCTASVVDSPRHNLLVTAAHCVYTATNGRLDDLVFVPGYRNGQAPYGSWTAKQTFVDPHWTASEDPEYDVAFLTVEPKGGREIEDLLGANELATDQGFGQRVSVSGYPSTSETPITCSVRTLRFSDTQERFDCYGYTDGTSGSPWLTKGGRVIGVIGGYQQGGDTDRTSYSVTFDHRVAELYRQATA
ncbi:trypsin-like peptidase domain-containing protein [Kitasatospora sp. NPDC002227]|uniref:trypsin-like serine peptidase n=1 Tax=Kitasatospora sp. NPDC002227 TaxID=3154773 RepID=UPI00331ADCA3